MCHPDQAVPGSTDGPANGAAQSDQVAQSPLDSHRIGPWLVAVGDCADSAIGVVAYEYCTRP